MTCNAWIPDNRDAWDIMKDNIDTLGMHIKVFE